MVWSFSGPLGAGLDALGLVPICPKRAVTPKHRGLEFRVKYNKMTVSRLAALSRCLWSYAKWQGSTMVPAGSFGP